MNDEMDIRIWLVSEIRENYDNEGRQPQPAITSAGFWGFLMVLDICVLWELLHELQTLPVVEKRSLMIRSLESTAHVLPRLIRILLGPFLAEEPHALGALRYSEHPRHQLERVKALSRDGGLCVATHTANPDVCYIFPPATQKDNVRTTVLWNSFKLKWAWGSDLCHRLEQKLEFGKTERCWDTTNKAANMICLSRQLQRSWARGHLALEPLESSSSSAPMLRLKVHWLRRTRIPSAASTVSFSADPRQMFVHEDERFVAPRPIEDGHIIEIAADSEDQLPDRDLLQFRWVLLRVHALSGAPDHRVYPLDYETMSEMMINGGMRQTVIQTVIRYHETGRRTYYAE
ncbi:Putative HNH nuclease [Colletotrichum destructivum]|uniref:HNH nuclease n=1 Tax=Colletotrichum destructivum TaxID=34406 RepID=A0AAX4IDU4_9PEZI|nr:Putative HNH nuclease [Colletotrichum destructivum]